MRKASLVLLKDKGVGGDKSGRQTGTPGRRGSTCKGAALRQNMAWTRGLARRSVLFKQWARTEYK